ncbi:type 11 methyltransferase, partial [Streptomyces sp. SID3343]|nr:type 11 methyltransferase [Streptomyces sp. SID3343]
GGDTARAFAPLNALKLEHAPARPAHADLARAMASLADPADIRRILSAAGYVDITVTPVEAPMHWGADAADAAEFVLASGPVRVDLDALPPAVLARLRSRARALLRPYETADGVRISGAVWLVGAVTGGCAAA